MQSEMGRLHSLESLLPLGFGFPLNHFPFITFLLLLSSFFRVEVRRSTKYAPCVLMSKLGMPL